MGHVEQGTGGISLDTHIPGLGQSSQGTKSAGARNLGLVLLVRRQVGDAANCVALDFNVGRVHLSYQRCQATKVDNKELVFR
jgi:hypothetical protein